MLQDYKLGLRMLLKYPGLTLAGGLALAVAIGIGAGWYDVIGKAFAPAIPLPAGDRLVWIEMRNTLTNEAEPRILRDFLEWRRELRMIDELGAYRTSSRNLIVDRAAPQPLLVAELTASAFGAAHVTPQLGRALLEADERPGAPEVIVLGYEVWQRSFEGRPDVVGSVVTLGNTPATVVGVMPDGFAYPYNHDAWTPLPLRASYEALAEGPISVIGRLVPGASLEQANAELRVVGERTAAALPATHEQLRPRVTRPGGATDAIGFAEHALRNVPVLLVLAIACLTVGTLVYARTATREGEIAVRSALGASRLRIIGQLFVESLVLASVAAAVGLVAADQVVARGIEGAGDAPFWMTPGLAPATILYAGGLAVISAAMLSVLPALRATRARVQPHLANLGSSGATLRFGRVWTGAMIVQVALSALGIPGAMEAANQTMRKLQARAEFPSRDYVVGRIDLDRSFEAETASAFQERRAQTVAALVRRIAQEPGVTAVTIGDYTPGSGVNQRSATVEPAPGAGTAHDTSFRTVAVEPGFFDTLNRPIVAGRALHAGDASPTARSVVVNEAFAREFARETGGGLPLGAQLRYSPRSRNVYDEDDLWTMPTDPTFEIVGITRNIGLDPDDNGDEVPFVFHAASAGTLARVVMTVRTRGNPATLAARLPLTAAAVDPRLLVRDAEPLEQSIRDRNRQLTLEAAATAGVTALVLFLSALGIFSLVSVGVSRRTREIGLRTALGANARHVLAGILSHAVVLMGSGIAAGGALLMLSIAIGLGPSGQPAEDIPVFLGHLGITSAVMLAACLLACIEPARRALRINPIDALRDV